MILRKSPFYVPRKEKVIQPILKYPGGKRLEIKRFASLIPQYDRYIEPFLGGGAVFFYLEPKQAIINDINPKLIRFYREVQTNYKQIEKELNVLTKQWQANKEIFLSHSTKFDPNEAFYYNLRDSFNDKQASPYSYGTLYYALNKLSFSAVRYNSRGEMNVPYGHRLSFAQTLKNSHHQLLSQTAILNSDYVELFNLAKLNDFLFLDPPYDTRFTSYGNLVDFKEEEQLRLAEDFKNLGTKALMILAKTPLIYELYKDSIYGSYEKRYAQNFSKLGAGVGNSATHLIITNYLKS